MNQPLLDPSQQQYTEQIDDDAQLDQQKPLNIMKNEVNTNQGPKNSIYAHFRKCSLIKELQKDFKQDCKYSNSQLLQGEEGRDKLPEERREEMEKHDLLQFRDMSARQFLTRVAFDIKLNSLYTIYAASNYNNFEKYAAVILKLGNRMRTVQLHNDFSCDAKESFVGLSHEEKVAGLSMHFNDSRKQVGNDKTVLANLQLIATDSTPSHITEQAFSAVFFLIKRYKPRWSFVREYIQRKTQEFLDEFLAIQLEDLEQHHFEFVLTFSQDPQCSLEKCENELQIVTNFAKQLHQISKFYTVQQHNQMKLNPPFLLQIWSIKGQCVYERSMDHTIKRWNLCNNILLFMEDDITVVSVECKDTKYDTIIRNYTIQEGSFREKRPTIEKEDFSNDQKVPERSIGLFNDQLIYIKKYSDGQTLVEYFTIDITTKDQFINIQPKHAKVLEYPNGELKWHMCCDEGDGDMLLIAEDLNHNHLLFFNLEQKQNDDEKLILVQQGLIKTRPVQTSSKPRPRVKQLIVNFSGHTQPFQSSHEKQASNHNETQVIGQSTMTCLALHEDNTVSTYADYAHIETWQVEIPGKNELVLTTQINQDGKFYLIKVSTKTINQTKKLKKGEIDKDAINQNQHMLKCPIHQRHNISKNQFSLCKSTKKDACALNSRIQNYFRLYSSMLNIGAYYLITHRTCVSLYDLRQSETNYQYCDTFSFKHTIKGLCQYDLGSKQISSKPDFISNIIVITEDNKIYFLNVKSREIIISTKVCFLPGEGAKIQGDQFCQSGIYLINSEYKFFVYAGDEEVQQLDISEHHQIQETTNVTCMPVNKSVFKRQENQSHNWHEIHAKTLDQKRMDNLVSNNYSQVSQQFFTAIFVQTANLCSVFGICRIPNTKNGSSGFQIEAHHALTFHKHPEDTNPLLDALVISGNSFAAHNGWYIVVSEKGLSIYNKTGHLQVVFQNMNIAEAKHMSEFLIIVLIKGSNLKVKSYSPDPLRQGRLILNKSDQEIEFKYDALYCIDIGSLLISKKLISYKLIEATVLADSAASNVLDFYSMSCRLGFLTNENKLKIIPFPHMNKVFFQGMEKKSNYIMWRSKNGFFSALHKTGILFTWSMIAGNLLYSRPAKEFQIDVTDYEPYQGNEADQLYYSQKNAFRHYTIQLLQYKPKFEEKFHKNLIAQHEDNEAKVKSAFRQRECHFKILKMQLHQDRDEDQYKMCGEEKISELFKFKFKLQEKSDDADIRDGIAQNRIFLSENTKCMMVIQQGYSAEFYKRNEPDPQTKEVEWTLSFRQDQFVEMLQQHFSFNFLFSPNFQYFLTFKSNVQKFYIVSTEFAEEPFQMEIPQDLFVTQLDDQLDQNWIQQTCQRFHFVSEEYFRIVNKEGIDCLIYFRDKKIQIERSFKIANFSLQQSQDRHLFLEDSIGIGKGDILPRLRHRCTESRYQQNIQQFWETQRCKENKESPDDPYVNELNYLHNKYFNCRKVLSNYFKIDCSQQPVKADNSFYTSEMTFTIANWILMDFLSQSEDSGYESIPDDLFLRQFFNIQPNGEQFLHQLVKTDNSTNYGILERGFTLAKKLGQELPIQYNNLGVTPIDYVLDIHNKDYKIFRQPLICSERNDKEDQLKIKRFHGLRYENLTAASKLFEYIKDYSYLSMGPMLTDAVIQAIVRELPNIGYFMAARCISSEHQPVGMQYGVDYDKLKLREKFAIEPAILRYGDDEQTQLEYGVIEQKVWAQVQKTEKQMFKRSGLKKKIRCFYIDIPFLHKQNQHGQRFIKALNDTEDKQIFKQFPIQAIVNFHWKNTKIWFMLCTFLPYLLMLCSYTYWSYGLLQQRKYGDEVDQAELTFRIIISICVIFFFTLEAKQLKSNGWEYFYDFWNYLELFPLLSLVYLITQASIQKFEKDPSISDSFYAVQAYTTFMIWMKLLFFMRLFRGTGYLVYSIFRVMADMTSFMIIFIVVIIAFDWTFIALEYRCLTGDCSQYANLSLWDQFKTGFLFVFNVVICNDMYSQDDALGQILFVLCIVVLTILMLNILIAIVSDSFQKVLDDEVVYTFSERCAMIREYQILLGDLYFKIESDPSASDLLFFACEDEDVLADKWFSDTTQANDRVLRQSEEDRVQAVQNSVHKVSLDLLEATKYTSQCFEEQKSTAQQQLNQIKDALIKMKPVAQVDNYTRY